MSEMSHGAPYGWDHRYPQLAGPEAKALTQDVNELRLDVLEELVPKMVERAEGLTYLIGGSHLDRHYAMHELLLLILEDPRVRVVPAGEGENSP